MNFQNTTWIISIGLLLLGASWVKVDTDWTHSVRGNTTNVLVPNVTADIPAYEFEIIGSPVIWTSRERQLFVYYLIFNLILLLRLILTKALLGYGVSNQC